MASEQISKPHYRNYILAWLTVAIGAAIVLFPSLSLFDIVASQLHRKTLWFISVVGVGLLGLGFLGSRNSWTLGALVFSLFVGGGAQLWLTQPLWFPTFTFKPVAGLALPMFFLVVAQGVLALVIHFRANSTKPGLSYLKEFGLLRIGIFLLLTGAFSVSIMGYLPQSNYTSYAAHLAAGGIVVFINLLTVSAMVRVPFPDVGTPRIPAVYLAVVTVVASALLSWFAFERIPHVEDEVAYLFQARTFASGVLWVPPPPEAARAGMEYYLLNISDGRWFGTPPPGWPAVLAIGVFFSSSWLVNPVLAGLSVLLAHRVTTKLANRTKADFVALLMCCSPWLLGASASMMPHLATLFLMLAAWNLLLMSNHKAHHAIGLALCAGLCMGWIFVTRQLDGLLIGVATGIWLVTKIREGNGVSRVVAYSIGCALAGSIFLAYNASITGDAFVAPLGQYLAEAWHKGANNYGFGEDIGPPGGWGYLDLARGHSVFEALINLIQSWTSLQFELFGWGCGSLALFWCLLIWGKPDRTDLAMMLLSAAVITALAFYWFSGSFYIGPRYWFTLFFPFIFLSASGYETLSSRLAKIGIDRNSLSIVVVTLCLFGLLVFTPWRGVVKYHGYGNFQSNIRSEMSKGAFGNAIVFFDIDSQPGVPFSLNLPRLPPDRPIFVKDLGEVENAKVSAAFPDRPVLYYQYRDKD